MERPAPKKNAECDFCLKTKPLLMPVGYAPGWPTITYSHLCLECRLAVKTSEYFWLVQDMIHGKTERERSAFGEWEYQSL